MAYNNGYNNGYNNYSNGSNSNSRSYGNSYNRYSNNRKRFWPKGKKNSNAWGRTIELNSGENGFIGGAWVYDFFRKTLFKLDITPKYSRKTDNGFESIDVSYMNSAGRVRYKVKCIVTNTRTFEKMYSTSVYNPDTGKIYFKNLDLMVNISKHTCTFNPFSGQFRPKKSY